MPRPAAPAFPAVQGPVPASPRCLNNVETLRQRPRTSSTRAPTGSQSVGTERSKGTKVFALGGKITNTGLVEVPMGTTLREIIYDIGGGCPGGKAFKAVQTGGPSGGCLPAALLDTQIERAAQRPPSRRSAQP